MAEQQDTMMNPAIEDLLSRSTSKFTLVTLGAMRARQINGYFSHLGDGLGSMVPPQVTSVARKPLSIAFEEISAGKIVGVEIDPDAIAAEEAAAEAAAAADAAELRAAAAAAAKNNDDNQK